MKTKTIIIALTVMLATTAVILQSCRKKENQEPICKITSPENGQEITEGPTVTITVYAYDINSSIAKVLFFVDGTGKSSVTSFPYNYDWNITNEYLGNHTLKATAIDNNGQSTSDEISVTLAAVPTAAFSSPPTFGTAPLTVNFIDQSSNTPKSWQWDFGDGSTSTQQNPDHTYNANGSYTVSLMVANQFGSDTETKRDYIIVNSGSGGSEPDGYFTDARNGQVYGYKIIGSQMWMAENLNIGMRIDASQDMTDNGTIEKYCYDDNPANCDTYGGLYQWNEMMQYTTQESTQGICPTGWHLPSDDEWKTLEMYLGMSQSEADVIGWRGTDEGCKMKETGTTHWFSPNTGATNTSGFTALPGGYRNIFGSFDDLGCFGFWWSSTEYTGPSAWSRNLYYESDQVNRSNYDDKTYGLSVRCLKN